MNYYELLGVHPHAASTAIHKAWRELSAKYHPDNQDTGDSEKFNDICEAHRVLSDVNLRKRYDESGMKAAPRISRDRVKEFLSEAMSLLLKKLDLSEWGSSLNVESSLLNTLEVSLQRVEEDIKIANYRLSVALMVLGALPVPNGWDPLREVISEKIEKLREKVKDHEEAAELIREARRVVSTYSGDPEPGGTRPDPGSTSRRALRAESRFRA